MKSDPFNKSYNKKLIDKFGFRSTAYIPILAILTDSLPAGLLMSQLLYWRGKGSHKDYIYKSARELFEEIHIKRGALEASIEKWEKLGVLRAEPGGVHNTYRFYIDIKVIGDLVREYLSLHSTLPRTANLFVENSKVPGEFLQKHTESFNRVTLENTENKILNKNYNLIKEETASIADRMRAPPT